MTKKSIPLNSLFLITLCLVVLVASLADAAPRVKYSNTVRSASGVIASARVYVYLTGTTTAANVYTASTGGSPVAYVTTNSSGVYTFYVDMVDYAYSQKYKLQVVKTGYTTQTLDPVYEFVLPDDAAGVLTNNGSGVWSWGASGSGAVSDEAYGSGWNGVTAYSPSKNAVYDKIETLIAAVQPLDSDLTAIASLVCSSNKVVEWDGAAWICGTKATGATDAGYYWTSQTEAGLSNEVNIGALTTGLLKISVAAGVATPSTAVSGTDFLGIPTHTGGACFLGYDTTGADGTYGCYNSMSLSDDVHFYNAPASTKKFRFRASGITAGATRDITIQDSNHTVVGRDTTDTLTNKTIDMGSNTLSSMPFDLNVAVPGPTASDTILFRIQRTTTMTSMGCMVDPGDAAESVVATVYECDSAGINCGAAAWSGTCANTTTAGTLTDASWAANVFMKVVLGTVTGTVSSLVIYGVGTQTW